MKIEPPNMDKETIEVETNFFLNIFTLNDINFRKKGLALIFFKGNFSQKIRKLTKRN